MSGNTEQPNGGGQTGARSEATPPPPVVASEEPLLEGIPEQEPRNARPVDRLRKREDESAEKDRSLVDLLATLDGYRPVIPEEVTDYYLQRSGVESQDARLNRLLSISAEKFISDIVSDAYQYSRIRTNATTTAGRPAGSGVGGAGGAGGAGGGRGGAGQSGPGSGGGQGGPADKSRTVLTMDDLSAALGEYGINARRADSYR